MRALNDLLLTHAADPSLLARFESPTNSHESGEETNGLSVTVVFTTIPATLMALQRGGELAGQLGARIRVLVPHVVPYPLPIERPQVDPEFKMRRLRTLSVYGAVETRIEVHLCRDAQTAVMNGLYPRSVVLIAGRKRWWPTREKRLVKELSRAGHHVIFVPQN